MKPHPRIRKTIKWGGAAVTVLLVVVWIGSGFWTLTWRGNQRYAMLWMGCFVAGRSPNEDPLEQDFDLGFTASGPYYPRHFFRLGFHTSLKGPWWKVQLPLWEPAVACLLPTLVAWRLDTLARRRALLNLCPKCNYDRTGILQDAKCPECGLGGGS